MNIGMCFLLAVLIVAIIFFCYCVYLADHLEISKFRCPRRLDFPLQRRKELIDFWRVLSNGDRVCSFCGSMHPDDVLSAIRRYGPQIIEKTSKTYKIYIHQPGVKNASDGGMVFYMYHTDDNFLKEFNELMKKD